MLFNSTVWAPLWASVNILMFNIMTRYKEELSWTLCLSLWVWALNPSNYICIVRRSLEWKYWVTWADIPIYIRSTKPHRGQIFYSNLAQISAWKDIKKNIFTTAARELFSIYLFLSLSQLPDWHFNLSFLCAKRSWMNCREQRKYFLFKWSSNIPNKKKHQKYYHPISGLAMTISIQQHITAITINHFCVHPSLITIIQSKLGIKASYLNSANRDFFPEELSRKKDNPY